MLNDEICKLRDKLNNSIEQGDDYNITYKLSIELDELIAKYYDELKNAKKKLIWTTTQKNSLLNELRGYFCYLVVSLVRNNYDVDALAPTIILEFYLMTFDWNEKQKIFYKKMSNVHGQNYYYINLNFSRFNT